MDSDNSTNIFCMALVYWWILVCRFHNSSQLLNCSSIPMPHWLVSKLHFFGRTPHPSSNNFDFLSSVYCFYFRLDVKMIFILWFYCINLLYLFIFIHFITFLFFFIRKFSLHIFLLNHIENLLFRIKFLYLLENQHDALFAV